MKGLGALSLTLRTAFISQMQQKDGSCCHNHSVSLCPIFWETGVADVEGTDEWCLLIPVTLCGGVGSGVAGAGTGVCTGVSFCFDWLIWAYLLLVFSWVWLIYLG